MSILKVIDEYIELACRYDVLRSLLSNQEPNSSYENVKARLAILEEQLLLVQQNYSETIAIQDIQALNDAYEVMVTKKEELDNKAIALAENSDKYGELIMAQNKARYYDSVANDLKNYANKKKM